MSCQDCEDFQDSQKTSFYRWKNANIEVRACEKHLKEIFEALNKTQASHQNYNPTPLAKQKGRV